MARIRTIKPEFWTDCAVGECSLTARLLFIGTWNVADDYGNLQRSAKQLRAQIFPYDTIDCEPLISELISRGLLVEYEDAGEKYLHIKGFDKHQKIERKSAARFPAHEDSPSTHRGLTEPSPSTHRGLTEHSPLEGKGRERKGKEGKGKTIRVASAAPVGAHKKSASRKGPIPPDFELTESDTAFAHDRLPDMHIGMTLQDFKDFHLAKGNQHIDWHAAWRTWVMNCCKGFSYVRRQRPVGEADQPRLTEEQYRALKAAGTAQ